MEKGCSVPDPCSSNPCPVSSYCSDDWDSFSCTCSSGPSTSGATKPHTDRDARLFLSASFLHRLLRHELHRRVLAEPLRTRVDLHQEAERLSRLHLRLSRKLFWPILREKVQPLFTFVVFCRSRKLKGVFLQNGPAVSERLVGSQDLRPLQLSNRPGVRFRLQQDEWRVSL